MPADKPTIPELMKVHLKGQSEARVAWNERKKRVEKIVNLKLFKGDLGPKLDTLQGLCQGSMEVKRFYAKLDDRTLGPVKKQNVTVTKTIAEYRRIITAQKNVAGQTPAQLAAWGTLETGLTLAETSVRAWLKKVGV